MTSTPTALISEKPTKRRFEALRLGLLPRILIALLLVGLLPVGIASFRLMGLNRDAMSDQVLRTHAVAARSSAARVEAFLEARRELARAAAVSPVLSESPRSQEGQEFLSGLLSSSLGIVAVSIRNHEDAEVIRAQRPDHGEIVDSVLALPTEDLGVFHGKGSSWLRMQADFPYGTGRLVLVVDLTPLRPVLDPDEMGRDAQLDLIGPKGELILGSSSSLEGYPQSLVEQALAHKTSGARRFEMDSGEYVLGAFSPVVDSTWSILSRQPSAVADAMAVELRRRSRIAVSIALALTLGLLLIAHRTVVRPIRSLVDAQRRLAGPGTGSTTGNEIVDLTSSFALLRKRMQEREAIGRVFLGRYQVVEVIGEGAMGTVFRGWDPTLKRSVALKTIRFDKSIEPRRAELTDRLLDEASTVAQLQHPNIVSVYDVGHSQDFAFLALEFVDGESLEHFIARNAPLDEPIVIGMGLHIAKGLAAAHQVGIVHNDIKPANVLLGKDGSLKLADFGVSQMVTAIGVERGEIYGTPGYIPPEALRGEGHGPLGDLFSLGVMLYRALTGKKAITGRSVMELMVNTVKKPIIHPKVHSNSLSDELSGVVMRLLERNPARRFQSAAALVSELEFVGSKVGIQSGRAVFDSIPKRAEGADVDVVASQVVTQISELGEPPRDSS